MALISFDLDGVLQRNPFHSGKPHGVFGHISRELAPYVPDADARTANAMVVAEHTNRLYSGDLVAAHDWDAIVNAVAKQVGYPGKIDVTALVEEYAKPGLIWLYPGAVECLQDLAEAGHTLITITNGFRCYQEPVLRNLGILDRFAAFITPDLAGAGKPQTPIFRAAEPYGRPRVHIGDTLPHDVAGAKRAGWKAIYVVQPGAPGATELPADLAALSPWERPANATDWLTERLKLDRRWHGFPYAELPECIPDAIVVRLQEIPGTVSNIL